MYQSHCESEEAVSVLACIRKRALPLTSIVAGGLEEMSKTTRLMPGTSFVMRFETCERKS